MNARFSFPYLFYQLNLELHVGKILRYTKILHCLFFDTSLRNANILAQIKKIFINFPPIFLRMFFMPRTTRMNLGPFTLLNKTYHCT